MCNRIKSVGARTPCKFAFGKVLGESKLQQKKWKRRKILQTGIPVYCTKRRLQSEIKHKSGMSYKTLTSKISRYSVGRYLTCNTKICDYQGKRFRISYVALEGAGSIPGTALKAGAIRQGSDFDGSSTQLFE